MTPASTDKSITARVAVILSSASLMGGFVWYSHIKAQPQTLPQQQQAVAQGEGAKTEAGDSPRAMTILPGSKRSNAVLAPDDFRSAGVPLPQANEDVNPAVAPPAPLEAKPSIPVFMSGSKAMTRGMRAEDVPKVFTTSDVAGPSSLASPPSLAPQSSELGAPNPPRTAGKGASAPPSNMMLSGSKSFAGPVISVGSVGTLTLGDGSGKPQALSLQKQLSANQSPPPSRVMMAGSKSLPTPPFPTEAIQKMVERGKLPSALPSRAETPIFTSSKSGPIFRTVPQVFPLPAELQAPASNAPPATIKAEEAVPQLPAATHAPASP